MTGEESLSPGVARHGGRLDGCGVEIFLRERLRLLEICGLVEKKVDGTDLLRYGGDVAGVGDVGIAQRGGGVGGEPRVGNHRAVGFHEIGAPFEVGAHCHRYVVEIEHVAKEMARFRFLLKHETDGRHAVLQRNGAHRQRRSLHDHCLLGTDHVVIDFESQIVVETGRKKSKEWNQNEALDFGRELRRAIDERNKSGKDNRSKSLNTIFRSPKNNNKSIRRKKHFSKEDIASEKLYIKLCTFYPDYEAFITKQHEIDGSYKMMQLVKRKILNDADDFGRRSH